MPGRTALIISLLCALSVGQVQAAFWDGTKLFQFLEKDLRGSADFEVGAATGYVIGIIDAVNEILICPPTGQSGISVKQAKHIVYNYMQKHPEMWHRSAYQSVTAALHEAYPCKK
jgi:Rap1a immunity proteins